MQTTLGNINLYVQDIERARQFYTETLGLIENKERSFPPTFFLLDAGSCTLTLQDASAPGAAFGSSDSVELGFTVEDIEVVRDLLKERGVKVSDVEQMGWGSGFDAVDPDGHRLAIYRMRDENPQKS